MMTSPLTKQSRKLNISKLDEFAIGLWLSLAAGAGIMLRSYQAPIAILILATVALAPGLAWRAKQSPRRGARLLAKGVLLVWLAMLAAVVLLGAERVYYTQADNYATWLTDGPLPADMSLRQLHTSVCMGRSPIEITARANGQYLLRCGFLWIESKLYTLPNLPEELSR